MFSTPKVVSRRFTVEKNARQYALSLIPSTNVCCLTLFVGIVSLSTKSFSPRDEVNRSEGWRGELMKTSSLKYRKMSVRPGIRYR